MGSSFDGGVLVVVLLGSLLTSAAAMAVTAVLARRLGKVAVVDITWGLVFVAIGWVAFALGQHSARSLLLAVLVTLWGGRLAWHIRGRALGQGEDPRYEKMLSSQPPEKRFRYALVRVFGTQGVAAWFVSLPLQVAAATDSALGWVGALGVLVWLVGVTFECDEPASARTDHAVVVGGRDTRGMTPAEIDAYVRERAAAGEDLYHLHRDALSGLDPDLVLTQDLCWVCALPSATVTDALAFLGCSAEVVALDPYSLADVLETIRTVG